MAQPDPVPMRDAHTRAVAADYDAKVGRWREIYSGTSFHDHTIQQRLVRTLATIDAKQPQPAGLHALDVGCGAGQLVVELARRGYRTSGVDLAAGMVAAARERATTAGVEATIEQADVAALPFPDESVDLLTALGVIEYLRDQTPALREFHRVLAPGGYAIVTSPNAVRLAFLLDPAGTVLGLRRRQHAPYPRTYLTPHRLAARLVSAGFEVVDVQGHGIGPLTVAGRPVLAEPRAIALGSWLEQRLPAGVSRWLGANLIAVARKPGVPRG